MSVMRGDTQVVEDTLGLGAGQELEQVGVEGWAGVSRGAEVLGEPGSCTRAPARTGSSGGCQQEEPAAQA